MKIKVKTYYNEHNNTNYYRQFDIIDALPEIGEVDQLFPERDGERTTVIAIREVSIDCENRDEAFEYNYYVIEKTFEQLNEDDEWEMVHECERHYVAIKKGECDEE